MCVVSSPALACVPRFYSSMVLLRPTRPHAAQLVFHCLDLLKDPNWSSCMHPETHLPFVTAVTCAALHPVRRASCTSKILSMYCTCFSFRCTQKIRKKTRPTAPRSSTIRVQVSGRFPCLDVFKVETGNLKSTIQQHLSIPCSKQHCTSQTLRSHSAFGDR